MEQGPFLRDSQETPKILWDNRSVPIWRPHDLERPRPDRQWPIFLFPRIVTSYIVSTITGGHVGIEAGHWHTQWPLGILNAEVPRGGCDGQSFRESLDVGRITVARSTAVAMGDFLLGPASGSSVVLVELPKSRC
jgi:hypothetical protein